MRTFDFIFPYDAMAPDFDQKKFFFKVSKWFNSQSYQVKIEIWKNIPFSAHYEGILARHLENSSKSNKLNMSSKMNKLNKWDNLHKSRSQFWSWGQVRQARYSSYLSHGGPHKFLLVFYCFLVKFTRFNGILSNFERKNREKF